MRAMAEHQHYRYCNKMWGLGSLKLPAADHWPVDACQNKLTILRGWDTTFSLSIASCTQILQCLCKGEKNKEKERHDWCLTTTHCPEGEGGPSKTFSHTLAMSAWVWPAVCWDFAGWFIVVHSVFGLVWKSISATIHIYHRHCSTLFH